MEKLYCQHLCKYWDYRKI